jgi:hypothetical protein
MAKAAGLAVRATGFATGLARSVVRATGLARSVVRATGPATGPVLAIIRAVHIL